MVPSFSSVCFFHTLKMSESRLHRNKKRSRSGSPTLDDCHEAVREALQHKIMTLENKLDDADRASLALRQERDTTVQQKLQFERDINDIQCTLRRVQEQNHTMHMRYADIVHQVHKINPDFAIPRRVGRNRPDLAKDDLLRFLRIP